jgi:hypothetical protein
MAIRTIFILEEFNSHSMKHHGREATMREFLLKIHTHLRDLDTTE